MVTENHYRWDFIGLSTDSKPTPSDSYKVTDGSTFYCADNSKLYVWYNNQWYERTAPGGGGESDYDFEDFTFTLVDGTEVVKSLAVEKAAEA